MRALREAHFWNPAGPFGTGCQWSDETLVQLAQSYPASVVATHHSRGVAEPAGRASVDTRCR